MSITAWLWNASPPYIPGSRPFKRGYQKQIAQEAQKQLKLFTDLPVYPHLDHGTKRHLLARVRHYENVLTAVMIWQKSVTDVAAKMCALLSLPLYMVLWTYIFALIPSPDVWEFQNDWSFLPMVSWLVYCVVLVLIMLGAFLLLNLLWLVPAYVTVDSPYLFSPTFIVGCLVATWGSLRACMSSWRRAS
jgi:hypothetical protein